MPPSTILLKLAGGLQVYVLMGNQDVSNHPWGFLNGQPSNFEIPMSPRLLKAPYFENSQLETFGVSLRRLRVSHLQLVIGVQAFSAGSSS